MTGMVPSKVPDMRLLAQRLRAQAADTRIMLYQRKLDGLASDLEEAALDAETREDFFKSFRLVS